MECRMWRASFRSGTWTVLLFLFLQMMVVVLVDCQGGGMMPLSEVIDHPVEKESKKSPTPNADSASMSKSEGETYHGRPLSEKKQDMHIKIAQSHLQEEESPVEGGEEKPAKIFRKDKSPELQNPMKHASDEWLLTFLLEQYRISETVEERVEILQNLENFSHKFENGRDLFKSTTAVKDILVPALNSTQVEIRKAACAVFAVAAQNNGVVQQIAKDAGAIRSLIHLLAFDPPVRSKALFALASLLRNYPEAQGKFIHDGGIPALIKVAFSFETRKRSLSLVTDLLTERKYCLLDLENRRMSRPQEEQEEQELLEEDDDDFTTTVETLGDHVDHYDNIDDPCDEFKVLEKALKDSGWCDVLVDSVKALAGFDTEDQLLTAEAVATSLSFCRNEISPYARIFQGLLVKFQDDEDFQEESLTLRSIIDAITNPSPYNKDEL
ncbi:Nucleotide exchange factor SIL1 [Orchesella cincta]|uniref:Nucleotide exchange factor SIL1 n=1 Tax=Orchesella cincta TaxID=48709 RepID=A0A1D2MS75_ORCCI|nr:Nucleotide exchange factor SIL1 [Orchesella cincta]